MELYLGVEIDRTDAGYRIQVWMEPPQMGKVSTGFMKMVGVPGGLVPKEMRLDAAAAAPGGIVMSKKPGVMFNQPLQTLGVEQQIQAVSPLFQPPQI